MALEDQFKQEDLDEVEEAHDLIMMAWKRDKSPLFDWVEESDDWFGFSDDSGAGLGP